jgi:hypothetical protein
MRRNYGYSPRQAAEAGGHRFAFPLAFLGSLIVIALILYVVDTAPLRALLLAP